MMSRQQRRAAQRLAGEGPTAAPAPTSGAGADVALVRAVREALVRKRDHYGEPEAMADALGTMMGVFSALVDFHGIERATRMAAGCIRDMNAQALKKRAQDIREGVRPPMTAEELNR